MAKTKRRNKNRYSRHRVPGVEFNRSRFQGTEFLRKIVNRVERFINEK